MNRGRGRKFNGRFNNSKEYLKKHANKRKAKNDKVEFVNKKAVFNRYKDKQRVEAEIEKKRKFEHRYQEQFESSESEEEDTYQQLLSTFVSKRRKVEETDSDESDGSLDEEQEEDELEEASDDEDVEAEDSDVEGLDSDVEGSEVGDLESLKDENGDLESSEELDTDVEDLENEDDEGLDEEDSDLEDEEGSEEEQDKDDNNKVLENVKIAPLLKELGSDSEEEVNIKGNEIDPEAENGDIIDESRDPFTLHFHNELSENLYSCMSSVPVVTETTKKEWPTLGKLIINIPRCENETKPDIEKKTMILEEKSFTEPGKIPQRITDIDYNALYIKSQMHNHIAAANKSNLIKNDLEFTDKFTPFQIELFSIMNNYQDLYYPERSFTNAEEIRFTYCMHAINHILKTRTKVLHHNAKLNKKDFEVPDEYRDQGLVRPKVLIMVPFKDAAYRIVKTMIEILTPDEGGQVVNKKRLDEEFTGGELQMPKRNPKPEDYELLFTGNTDDTVKLGMAITKKTLKLYTDFYSSDIIIASPLGLRVIVGAEGERDRDYDFLASVEVLIMDQTDVFLMQNWEHVLHVMDLFHLQLKETHGTDFSRIRPWAANGWAKYYRQSLIFSSVPLPEISSLFNKRCHNYAGKVRVVNPVEQGSIRHVAVQVPQVFHRISADSPLLSLESRFDFFIKEVLPAHRDTLMAHTLIYVPSYFDYVKIRNYFKKEDISFVQICEYSKDAKIARARDMFFHTEAHFILYSERAHFFRRFRIKGVRHIIFYQPPTFPHFYSEICNFMQEANQNKYGGSSCNMSVTVVYSKYDLQAIATMVGSERAHKMAVSDQNVHMFMTGE